MAADVSTRVVWNAAALRALRTSPDVMAMTEDAAGGIADELVALAPKDSGGAAGTIDVRAARAAGAFNVGWDAQHWYMIFPEYGTKHQPAQRFARNTLYRYIYH